MNWQKVCIRGRHIITEGTLWLTMSGSEVVFTFCSDTCRITLRGDDTATDPEKKEHRASYSVYINDELYIRDIMDQKEKKITVRGSRTTCTRVRITKLSECTSSLLGIADIKAGRMQPAELSERKIEVIGDSITCGYGVEGNERQTFSTATENAEKAYGMLIGQFLDADVRMDCFSGFGIVSGYTENGVINDTCLVPLYYEKTGMNDFLLPDGKKIQEIPWDFSLFRPDTIVVNLGTNDLSWCKEDEEKKNRFRMLYSQFLKMIRNNNRDAVILCVLGIMGTGLNEKMIGAVSDYKKEMHDDRVFSFAVDEQDGNKNGWGTDFHPSEKTQRLFAECVAEEIRNVWSKVEKRPEI